MEPINFRPLHDHVVIFQPKSSRLDRTAGGLYRPDSAKKWDEVGIVVAVGPGRVLDGGQREVMETPIGARVIFASHILMELEHLSCPEGRFGLLRDRDIHAVVDGARRIKTVEVSVAADQELSDPELPELGIIIHDRSDHQDGLSKTRSILYSYDHNPDAVKTVKIPLPLEQAAP